MSNYLSLKVSHSVDHGTKLLLHAYIRECESMICPNAYEKRKYKQIIPELVAVLVLLYFNQGDYISGNGMKSIFHYNFFKYGNYHRVFGTKSINRKYNTGYEWLIEIGDESSEFNGRIGIINDIFGYENSKLYHDGETHTYWRKHEVINVGSISGSHLGHFYGDCRDRELRSFIPSNGILKIIVNFDKNIVIFESNKGKKVTRKLKNGIQAVRFCAEFTFTTSTIKFITSQSSSAPIIHS